MRLPDIQLIQGETVTVRTPTTAYDEHMDETVTWTDTTVGNVVVAPASTSDETDTTRPHATRAAFKLGFPKPFDMPLRGRHVIVRGVEYAVIGDPQPNTLENCPTPWWYSAEVEAVDG